MDAAISPPLHVQPLAEPALPQTVAALVARYEEVEALCEKAIESQERLARQIYAQHSEGPPSGRTAAISDIAFAEFRQMHALARKLVPVGLPNASRRFVTKAGAPGLVEIEDMEETIRQYRCRMSVIEQEILNLAPASVQDAAAKLTFMACLMLDGGNLEVDFFAYLVEECAFVIAAQKVCD